MNTPRVVLPGIVTGAVVLLLLAALGIFLPKATGSTGDLALPDSLSGGYVAADLREAYADLQQATDEQKASYVTTQVNARAFADQALAEAGVDGVSRNYLSSDGSGFIAVQLLRAEGGAVSPFLFTDPATADASSQIDRLVNVGDALCIETGFGDGQGGFRQSLIECQKSDHGLTLQLTTQGTVETVEALIEDVWAEVA